MKRFLKDLLTVFLVPVVFSAVLSAQEIQFNGMLSASVSPGFGCYDSDYSGKMIEDNLSAEGKLKLFYNDCTGFVDGSISFDGVTQGFDNRLKEVWFDWNCSNVFALRIGRQIAGWGKADELQVADVLCPQDLTTVLSTDYADTRLGIDALRLSLMGNVFSTDFYWIPHFTPSKLPDNEKKPIYGCIYSDGVPDRFETPETNLENSEFALRINASFPAIDFALYGFSGWDDEPIAILKDTSVVAQYKRMWMAGCDAAIPVKDFVFRLEAAYFPQKYYGVSKKYMSENQYVQNDTLKALGGIDWNIYPFSITAQYYAEAVFGDIEKIENERVSQQVTLSISRNFLNELLEVSFSGALHLNDLDSMVELACTYSVTDNLKLTGQVDFYNSGLEGKNGIYGTYKKLSCGTLKAEFRF